MPQDKKEQIIQKALQLFAKENYERTSMRDLAKAVGIKAPGIYYYFKSKRDILNQIDADGWNMFRDLVLKKAQSVADPIERIKLYIRNMIQYQFELGEEFIILYDLAPKKYLKNRIRYEREVFYFLRDNLREIAKKNGVQNTIDPTVGAFLLYALVSRIFKWYEPKGKITFEELIEQVIRLFLHGFLGREV